MAESGMTDAQRFSLPATDTEAHAVWERAVVVFTEQWSTAWSISMMFRGSGVAREAAATNAINKQYKKLERIGFFKDLPKNKVKDANSELIVRLQEQAKRAEAIAMVTVMHAALETLIYDLLRVIARRRRPQVFPNIGRRKLEIADLITTDLDVLLDRELGDWLIERTRRPLLENWKVLFSLAPPSRKLIDVGLPYDEEWLTRFDLARQDAVHHGGGLAPEFATAQALHKIKRMAEFLFMQVGNACEFSFEPKGAPDPMIERFVAVNDVVNDLMKIIGEVPKKKKGGC